MSNLDLPLEVIKALSEPANKLIDAVAEAVGVVYEPTKIRRKARAEADAAIILAENWEHIREIEYRAAQRFRDSELRRQQNIDSITQNALDSLPQSVSDVPVDPDWVYEFYQQSQNISNKDMQLIWGKILAGEVAAPGSFSRRTLEVVRSLSAEEAKLFNKFCQYIWVSGQEIFPIIPEELGSFFSSEDMSFISLRKLKLTGLIDYSPTFGFEFHSSSEPACVCYFEHCYQINTLSEEQKNLRVGVALLTDAGEELSSVIDSHPSIEYEKLVLTYLENVGHVITQVPTP